MKSGISWNLRGIDDEIRDAAVEAARQSGQSVADWLNEAIARRAAEQGVAPGRDDDELSALAGAVGEIARRLRAMEPGPRSIVPGLRARLDDIERQLAQIREAPARNGPAAGSLQGVSAMVGHLARELDDSDEKARTTVEGQRARAAVAGQSSDERVGAAIRSLDDRIAAMTERINAPPSRGNVLDELRDRLDSLLARGPEPSPQMRSSAAVDTTLRGLEARIDQARARLVESGGRSSPLSGAEEERMRRIESRLADIGGRLDEVPAARPGPPPAHGNDEIEAVIAEIAAGQRRHDPVAIEPPARQDSAIAEALTALRADMDELVRQTTARGKSEAEGQGASVDLARRIEALSAELPAERAELASIRHEIEALRAIAGDGARETTVLQNFDRISRKLPDSGRLDALGEEVSAVRRAVESTRPPTAAVPPADTLGRDIAAIRRSIETAAGAATGAQLDALAAEVSAIRRTVESAAAPRGAGQLDALAAEVGAIRRALEEPMGQRAVGRVEMRLSELARSVEAALNSRQAVVDASIAAGLADIRGAIRDLDAAANRPADGSVGRLEQRLDEIAVRIDGILDRAVPAELAGGLDSRLEALVARLDLSGPIARQGAVLDEIKGEIGAIRAEIAARGGEPRVDHIEAQLRDLDARLRTVPETAASQLAELESEVARLAGNLERALPRTVTLEKVEENLARLQAHLSENRKESVDAARVAARDAVRDLSAREIGSELIAALKENLEHVRAAASDSDQRTQRTMGSLHDALTAIVSRLTRLEGGIAEPIRAPAAPVAAPIAPAATVSAMALHPPPAEPIRAPEEPVLAAGHKPLEPGSGKPDLAALRELAASSADKGRPAADRRADFIAAARRAAQAASPESRPTTEKRPSEPGQSAFARIGQAIRNRKRTLLLAAAIVVLAAGGWQILASSSGSKGAPVAVARIKPEKMAPEGNPIGARLTEAAPVPPPTRAEPPALVAPPADGRTAMALASPEAVEGRFGNAFTPPASEGFSVAQEPGTAPQAEAVPPPAEAAPGQDVQATNASLIGPDKLRAAVTAGDPAAYFEVADRYAEGHGVDQSLATAAEWYKRAADAGLAMAQYRLGSMYERGEGVARNPATAVDWYQRAADQGNVGAMHNLAVMLSQGAGGQPDPMKALQWFIAAANYGVKDSQYNLGVIYARGIGPQRDLIESFKWFSAAAAQGDTDSAAHRDEIAGLLPPDQLAKAQAATAAFHAKPVIPEPNSVATPPGGWDNTTGGITEADRRELVKTIQTLLAEHGYDPGPADGVSGPKTREAVRAFQRTIGASDTGEIDRSLATALADRSG